MVSRAGPYRYHRGTGPASGRRARAPDVFAMCSIALARSIRRCAASMNLRSACRMRRYGSSRARVAGLPRTTEVERLVIQRIGQDIFRARLWTIGGPCPLTGISDADLLRASHIIPWSECGSDAERLDVHNGLLLSALWDAAFDAGLVSFDNDGEVIASPRLTSAAVGALDLQLGAKLSGLTETHQANLAWHRTKYGLESPKVSPSLRSILERLADQILSGRPRVDGY